MAFLSFPTSGVPFELSCCPPLSLKQANPVAFVGEDLLTLLCLPESCCHLVIKAWQAFLLLLLLPLKCVPRTWPCKPKALVCSAPLLCAGSFALSVVTFQPAAGKGIRKVWSPVEVVCNLAVCCYVQAPRLKTVEKIQV